MYTQCPECNTGFRITTTQLRMGQGNVTCSKCGALFDAISSLSDVAFEDHFSEIRKLPTLPLEQALAPPVETAETPDALDRRPKPSASRLRQAAWFSGILALTGLLIAQIGFFEGRNLAQNEKLRPWLDSLCARLHCELPEFRNPAAIDILERSLLPAEDDTLQFRIVVVNAGRLQQAFPRIRLDLIQLNGELFARRVVSPEEYLKGPNRPASMKVGEAFEIKFNIVRPAEKIGGFEFTLI